MTFTTINSASGGFTHDLAGKVTSDHVINYVYDQEGRICAVQNTTTGSKTQYVYDAEGRRVAKGTITSLPSGGNTCAAPTTANGFTLTNVYLRGLHGDQDSELNGQGALIHTNVYVEGGVTATYWDSPQYGWEWSYEFSDWQGTKRVQVKPGGQLENAWQSDPYNDYMTPLVVGQDATEHHYTQKERDIESGNDYFGARYYTSLMGRFMSPDWSAKVEPVPYAKVGDPQSLNLYAFVGNNPLNHVDVDGHDGVTNGLAMEAQYAHEIDMSPKIQPPPPANSAAEGQQGAAPTPTAQPPSSSGDNPPTITCAGDAYVMAGNPRNVGHEGAPGVTVTNGSAAVVPSQWTGSAKMGPDLRAIGQATSGTITSADGKTTEKFNSLTQPISDASFKNASQAQAAAMNRIPGALVLEIVGGKDLSATKLGKTIVYVPAHVVLTMPNTSYGCPTGTSRIAP